MTATAKKVRTNITLDRGLAEDAREYRLNVSAIAEGALREAVRQAKAKAWAEENAEALRQHEEWLHKHGHPLKEYMPDWAREAWEQWQSEPLR